MRRGGAATPDEDGSGTVAAIGVIAGLMVLFAVVHLITAAAAAGAQAARAADLAALAAADTARGLATGDPCAAAEQVAVRNSAAVLDCRVGGEHETEVRVTVSVEAELLLLPAQLSMPGTRAERTSRAGPPEALQAGHVE
ncbi:Rv3654c family TadE-like protein [Nesterenkonia populi]|uniref:Rv3654c family TadE-like protein n=1 Tax=Nesterenkonia populi TaxID=1591087 RepID=UPI0011BECED7|nr:Rv3654c family TadE-like protein [Nesterenkonia populi]